MFYTLLWSHVLLPTPGSVKLFFFVVFTSQTRSNKATTGLFTKASAEMKILRGWYSRILQYAWSYRASLSSPEQTDRLIAGQKQCFCKLGCSKVSCTTLHLQPQPSPQVNQVIASSFVLYCNVQSPNNNREDKHDKNISVWAETTSETHSSCIHEQL